ncbi:MAG: DUF4097 family beta strand repeat protein [Planctomycetes bacterium]|nr:DUF4097 family beta strand repeat protein [Planctomycetota bacterium]
MTRPGRPTTLRTITNASLLLTCVVVGLAGCVSSISYPYKAEETRVQTIPYVQDTGIQVDTANGRIEVTADPSRSDIELTAKVRASGSSQFEADERLANIVIQVESRVDPGTGRPLLDVSVKYLDARRGNEGCSFALKVPAANGVNLDSSNGSLTIAGLTGEADLHTSNGKVRITNHEGGSIAARSSNGSIELVNVTGDTAVLDTSNGPVRVEGIFASLDVETSNGGITYTAPMIPGLGGSEAAFAADFQNTDQPGHFSLRSSNGPVTVKLPVSLAPGVVKVSTSNGKVKASGTTMAISGSKHERTIVIGHPEDSGTATETASRIRTSNGSVTVEVID